MASAAAVVPLRPLAAAAPAVSAASPPPAAEAPSAAPRFRPRGQEDLAPSGAVARVRANLEALATLRRLEREGCPATPSEQAVLARWSGWGAVPEVFDPAREELAWARARLAELLGPEEVRAAARNTLNAHYTDAELVRVIWAAARRLGFVGGRVLEPGCGSGNFIGFAPEGGYDLVVGNVPFAGWCSTTAATTPPATPSTTTSWSSRCT